MHRSIDIGFSSRMMRLKPRFLSSGCNRIVNALDWGDCDLIAYASANAVCIYDPEVSKF